MLCIWDFRCQTYYVVRIFFYNLKKNVFTLSLIANVPENRNQVRRRYGKVRATLQKQQHGISVYKEYICHKWVGMYLG